jgi:DNA-binding IscR family transcriptional regulator
MLLVRLRDEHSQARGARRLYDPLVALEIFAPVATAFHRGDRPVAESSLSTRTHYSPTIVRETVKRLIRANFLRLAQHKKNRGLLPSRSLDTIRLDELVAVFLQDHVTQGSAPVDRLWEEFRRNTRLTLEGYTALELVDFDAFPPLTDELTEDTIAPDQPSDDNLDGAFESTTSESTTPIKKAAAKVQRLVEDSSAS